MFLKVIIAIFFCTSSVSCNLLDGKGKLTLKTKSICTRVLLSVSDPCYLENNGKNSVCVLLRDCDEAKIAVKRYEYPQICGFVGIEPIVCCPNYKPVKEKLKTKPRTGYLARTG